MFGQASQRQYGTLMHERLRRLLSASLYDFEGPEDHLVWLAQARLLCKVVSLYLGQTQGFSYAQHLNAIANPQLERMDHFREPSLDELHRSRNSVATVEAELEYHQEAKTRWRLAYEILRIDIYCSVLLSTRPTLTSHELSSTRPTLTSHELKMTVPRSHSLWMNAQNVSAHARL